MIDDDPLPPSNELREMRQFMGRMMTFWTFLFPAWFAFQGISRAIELGPVWAAFIGAFWVFIFWFAWTIRRLFKMLMVTQDLRDEVGYLELVDRKARVEARSARRARAQARLQRIQSETERRVAEETVDDLVDLAEELGSDTPPSDADT